MHRKDLSLFGRELEPWNRRGRSRRGGMGYRLRQIDLAYEKFEEFHMKLKSRLGILALALIALAGCNEPKAISSAPGTRPWQFSVSKFHSKRVV